MPNFSLGPAFITKVLKKSAVGKAEFNCKYNYGDGTLPLYVCILYHIKNLLSIIFLKNNYIII